MRTHILFNIEKMLMPVIHMLFQIVEVLPVRENQRLIMRLLIVNELVKKKFIYKLLKQNKCNII